MNGPPAMQAMSCGALSHAAIAVPSGSFSGSALASARSANDDSEQIAPTHQATQRSVRISRAKLTNPAPRAKHDHAAAAHAAAASYSFTERGSPTIAQVWFIA